jgi:hypothetical protein
VPSIAVDQSYVSRTLVPPSAGSSS